MVQMDISPELCELVFGKLSALPSEIAKLPAQVSVSHDEERDSEIYDFRMTEVK